MQLDDVIRELAARRTSHYSSDRAHARAIGCSPGYLCGVYQRKYPPGQKILDHLGMERIKTKTVSYRRNRDGGDPDSVTLRKVG